MANKRVKVSVTEEDYQVARTACTASNWGSWPCYCLIATAVRRYIPSLRSCGNDCLHIPGGTRIELPKKVRNAIWDFDHELPVDPFSFSLRVPEELLGV